MGQLHYLPDKTLPGNPTGDELNYIGEIETQLEVIGSPSDPEKKPSDTRASRLQEVLRVIVRGSDFVPNQPILPIRLRLYGQPERILIRGDPTCISIVPTEVE